MKVLQLSEQCAFVTGAGDSVGLAVARRFLAEGGKAHIMDVNADAVAAALEATPELTGTVGNAGDTNDIDRAFNDAETAMGRVDTLINGVGVAGPMSKIDETSIDDWRRAIDINLNGHFYAIHRAVPGMRQRGAGVIVGVSSTSAAQSVVNRASYVSSKAGLEALVSVAAQEYGQHGIRCNVVRPGGINNDRVRLILEDEARQAGISFEEHLANELEGTAMRTLVEIDDVVDAIIFLCSPAARYVTGQITTVSAGLSI
ncbi:MAG: SDR family oxidoreductase [Pseudomonadota bacterium]